MAKSVLAVDLGGTNLRIATVSSEGTITARKRCATPNDGDARSIIAAIVDLIGDLRHTSDIAAKAVGVAAPVIMDLTAGRIDCSPNLPQLNGYRLIDELEYVVGLPIVLENDATAAAIGESWLGSSRTATNSICLTLGTGVGGGLIIDGEPYRGIDGTAGEIGHLCVEPDGHPCGCGGKGCLEQYASATAIERFANESMTNGSRAGDLTAERVYKASKEGDMAAAECFRRMGTYLGIALAGLINIFNPEVIVLGGGVSAAWDAFIPEALDQIEKRAFRVPGKRVKLVRAELGDDAGLLGVAKTAFASIEQGIKGV
jgi:glucokinase